MLGLVDELPGDRPVANAVYRGGLQIDEIRKHRFYKHQSRLKHTETH